MYAWSDTSSVPTFLKKTRHCLGIYPSWYVDYLRKLQYMFPKGHCVAFLLIDLLCAYYESNAGKKA